MTKKSNLKRGLEEYFLADLKRGILSPLLNLVKESDDLILEIRENYLNIYYRGGSLFKVEASRNSEVSYTFKWDAEYKNNESFKLSDKKKLSGPKKVTEISHCDEWVGINKNLKKVMDDWFRDHSKKEREIQQLIATRENVLADYILTDFEYQKVSKKRFDLIGVERENLVLTFLELKQGYSSLRTKINEKSESSGLAKHLKDMLCEIKNQESLEMEIRQAQRIYEQKRELGLTRFEIDFNKISKKSMEILFVLANFKTEGSRKYSKNLRNELDEILVILDKKKIPGIEVKVGLIFLDCPEEGKFEGARYLKRFCESKFYSVSRYNDSGWDDLENFLNDFYHL